MSLLERVFGPRQNEVWKQLSDEIGGEFIQGGVFKGGSKVQATIKNWAVVLDTYTVSTGKSSITFTRMRALFSNPEGFRFTIYRKNIFSALGKFFGMQDVGVGGPAFENLGPLFGVPGYLDPLIIETGDPGFDADFIIKCNDEAKVRALFKQFKIRELVQSQPAILLQVKRGPQKEVDELYFQVTGVIKDLNRLKSLFELYEAVLSAFPSLSSRSEEPMSGPGDGAR
jgi:hypothetical protein